MHAALRALRDTDDDAVEDAVPAVIAPAPSLIATPMTVQLVPVVAGVLAATMPRFWLFADIV